MDSQIKSAEEQQFLEAIALELNLIGDPRAAFLARFNPKNANKKNSNLVSCITWNNELDNKSQKLQEELQNICKILEDNGCPLKEPKLGRAPKVKVRGSKGINGFGNLVFQNGNGKIISDYPCQERYVSMVKRILMR